MTGPDRSDGWEHENEPEQKPVRDEPGGLTQEDPQDKPGGPEQNTPQDENSGPEQKTPQGETSGPEQKTPQGETSGPEKKPPQAVTSTPVRKAPQDKPGGLPQEAEAGQTLPPRWKHYAALCLETLLAGAALLLFTYVTSNKLDYSSLWFDEAIEYWYSKVMFGTLPFSATTTMYQRVVSTLQPPLYNVLLHFWLMISDSPYWIRSFGVACGILGMAALYGTVRSETGSPLPAAAAVSASACIYWLAYYWQEAAEYCLMLALLFWTVLLWFRLLAGPTLRRIILFTLLAVLSVYSQYGAVFPALALAVMAWLMLLVQRRWRALGTLTLSLGCAALFAGLPLYWFFLRQQISIQHHGGQLQQLSFTADLLPDCLDSLHTVFRWCFAADYSEATSRLLLMVALCGAAGALLFGSGRLRAFTLANAGTWFLYYFAVKLGVYADMYYGGFGNRYNLFFYPLWIAWGFLAFFTWFHLLSALTGRLPGVLAALPSGLFAGMAAGFLIAACHVAWMSRIEPNWEKEYIREVVSCWYQDTAPARYSGNMPVTVVYYAADAGFAYYLRQNPVFSEKMEQSVHYMDWLDDRTGEEYRAWLDQALGADWPDTVYLAASHYTDDLFPILEQFLGSGYQRRDVYNYAESCLLCLTRTSGGAGETGNAFANLLPSGGQS